MEKKPRAHVVHCNCKRVLAYEISTVALWKIKSQFWRKHGFDLYSHFIWLMRIMEWPTHHTPQTIIIVIWWLLSFAFCLPKSTSSRFISTFVSDIADECLWQMHKTFSVLEYVMDLLIVCCLVETVQLFKLYCKFGVIVCEATPVNFIRQTHCYWLQMLPISHRSDCKTSILVKHSKYIVKFPWCSCSMCAHWP